MPKTIINRLGTLIALIALGYLGHRVYKLELWSMEGIPHGKIAALCGVGSLFYAGNQLFVAAAWRGLVCNFNHTVISLKTAFYVYGTTQIAKYLPGNVFHFSNRHIAGARAGISHTALVGALIFEIAGMVTASSAIILFGFALWGASGTSLGLAAYILIFIIMATAPVAMYFAATRIPQISVQLRLPQCSLIEIIRGFIPAYFLYAVFFLIAGLILFLFVELFANFGSEIDVTLLARVIGIFSAAWLSGYVTPGAPSGIGVREEVIHQALKPITGEAQAIVLALAFRVLTTLSDFVFYLMARGLKSKHDLSA